MNLGTAIVLIILIAVVCTSVRSMIINKKKGKSQCGCDCGHCGGNCH